MRRQHIQRIRQPIDHGQRGVALTTLYTADVGAVDPGPPRQLFLRVARPLTVQTYHRTKRQTLPLPRNHNQTIQNDT